MTRRGRLIAVVVMLALVLGLVYTRTRSPRPALPDRPGSAQRVTTSTVRTGERGDSPATRAGAKAQTPEQRKAMLAAIEAARAKRLAGGATAAAPHAAASSGGASTVLDLADKTGDTSAWEKRTLGTLNALLGECIDLAQTEQPDLAGTLTVQFTVAGEPQVGGLLEQVSLDEEHSSIAQPTLRECVQQSLYALELDPPPDGVRVGRQVSLRVP